MELTCAGSSQSNVAMVRKWGQQRRRRSCCLASVCSAARAFAAGILNNSFFLLFPKKNFPQQPQSGILVALRYFKLQHYCNWNLFVLDNNEQNDMAQYSRVNHLLERSEQAMPCLHALASSQQASQLGTWNFMFQNAHLANAWAFLAQRRARLHDSNGILLPSDTLITVL